MIIVEIHKNSKDLITSIVVSGHAEFACDGRDIVCSAASTLVYTAIGALSDLCGMKDFYRIVDNVDPESVTFSEITMPADLPSGEASHTAQIILQTVRIGFLQLEMSVQEQYGNQYIKVLQTLDDNLEG
jgi:uncharacterized protein YsxB (DUF464 family)